jgi:NADH-dependent peroxiredoxin subunit F
VRPTLTQSMLGDLMLEPKLAAQLATHLTKITMAITLVASLDDSVKSVELAGLLDEISSLSESISVSHRGIDARRPSFAIERDDTDISVHFAAIPLGHEFTSLVLALLNVGGHPSTQRPELIEQVASITGTHRFETYVSLSCQNCPDVVQALNLMAIVNPNIEHVTIDGSLFPDEVESRQVMSVPTVFVNGEVFDHGRMTLEQIVAKLDSGASTRAVEVIDAKDPFDVLILGGGPAGAAAAVYAARKGLRTGIVVDRFGGQLLDTLGIDNLISTPHTEGPRLALELEANVKAHDVDIITRQRVSQLLPAPKPGGLIGLELESGASLQARSVIVSTGARWRQMNVPGEAEYANRGVAYCPHCDGPLYKNKRVAVVGGGNSGVEAAIDLAGLAAHVSLIEFGPSLRADEVLQAKLGSLPNVDVFVGTRPTAVVGDGARVTGLTLCERETDVVTGIDIDGIFVQIGLLPNTEWLRDTIELTDRGEVVIDERGQTSSSGVFAAGDCTTEPFKQIVVAIGAGSTAALSAFDHLIRTSTPDGAHTMALVG